MRISKLQTATDNNDGFITKQEMLNTTSELTAKQVLAKSQIENKKSLLSDQVIGKDGFCAFKRVSAVFDRTDKDGDKDN